MQTIQERLPFLTTVDGRYVFKAYERAKVIRLIALLLQNLFVQEDQGIQNLSGERHGFIDREMIKKHFDMELIQRGGMLIVVEEDVLSYPVAIVLFSAGTVMTAVECQVQSIK